MFNSRVVADVQSVNSRSAELGSADRLGEDSLLCPRLMVVHDWVNSHTPPMGLVRVQSPVFLNTYVDKQKMNV